MVESFLTQNLLTRGETAIGDYLRTGQSDYSNIWKESFADMLLDFDTMDLNIRQLCERLSLQASVTKTAAFTGAISDQDYAQRMRLVIPVSAITGSAVFTLQGSDDEGSNYEDITMVADDGDSGTTHTISAIATGDRSNSYIITRMYEKYRLKLISIGTTITYTAYMIENIYTTLHVYKTRANIYRSLVATVGDEYQGKMEQYDIVYDKLMSTGRLRVDYSDDNEISEAEGDKHTSDVRFSV